MLIIAIIGLSVLLQFTAAFLAFRLIRITGKSFGWTAISAAIVLMGARRLVSAYHALFLQGLQPDLGFEVLGLITSLLMVAGVAWIAPIFRSMKDLHDRQEKLIEELREAAANINTLKGLLPICSACKKIRDDRGYWSQIETYLGRHSEAEFSHSICPECAEKLYGHREGKREKRKGTDTYPEG